MKRLLVALIAPLAFAGVAQAAPSIDFRCQPGGLHSCAGWYRVPVEVTWVYNTGDAEPIDGNCTSWTKKTFTADTAGTSLFCRVKDPSNPLDTVSTGTTIHIDQTAPTITGPGLARPPDGGAWFNRPVAFAFTGADATSGIASCTGGTYGGPDGAGVGISGSCQDVAGNVTSGAFTINYDATPPADPNVSVRPGNHRVALRWESAQNLVAVLRIRRGKQKVVFFGGGERFTDRRLRNGRRYRYVVTVVDQAGNRSSDSASAVPTNSKLLLPADGARLTSPPELVWKRIKHASYYNAQLRFRGVKVLTRWPVSAHLQLTERWRALGRRHHLARGRYCWYVWPGFGARRLQRYGDLMGVSCFRIVG